MANVSDKLASMACPLGIVYAILAIAAAQSPPPQGTPVLINKGVVVSLFPYPYPGHVELFEGVNPSQMSQTTSSTQHPFQQENILITQLVPDPGNDAMYYIDVYTNSIYRWDNVTSTLNDQSVSTITQTTKVFEGLSRAICKLDLDYLTQNIYWSDPLLHWIAIKPANSADPADTKLLITDDVDYVAALTLDVENKLLFWVSSAYDDAKMERSNLLGEERQMILSTSFGFVDDMTLDMKEKQLYWVDSFRMTVETAAYDGSGRRIIRRLIGTEFTSIAVMESNICLINFDSYEMQCMFKTSGDRYAYHNFYPSNPYAVGFFNPGIQKTPLENKCATKNCAHICVNTASQPKCLCGDGYTLDSDGTSCSRTNPLYVNAVVMTNSTHICMIQVSSLSSTASYKPIRCEVTNATKDTTHIQSHVAKNLLYYTAKSTEPATLNKTQLVQFDLLSQRHRVVVEDIEEPDDMVFDWVGEKMFTCHSKLNQIKSWDVVTGRSSIIYSGNEVTQVSELAIDPHRANLFWIAGTMATGLGIYVGTFVGGAATILVESGSLTRPSGISYEDLDDSVCFIDNGRFASVTVNGTLTNHRISVGSATMSLIYKNYAIWNDGPSTLKMSLFSLDASVYSTDTTMGTINSIALFSGESQKAFLDPCKISNGGCDDLCFRQNATVYCRCDFGRTLQPDGKACGATPLANNFMLVTDLSHDRIVQVSSDGNTLVSLPINNLMTPAMVRYGHHDNMLYWCEVGSKDIKRGNLNGAGVERLVTIGGESYPDRFAIDFTTNHLYYTVAHTKDINSSYIAVMVPRADQAETKTLIRGLNYVGGIVVHPAKGYIYFNEHGIETYIARAYSDGTNIKQLVKFSGGGQPLGMAIDYANNMLYWADAYTDQDKIEYIDLEGTTSSRGVLIRDMTSDPVDVTISAGFLFFVAYNKHQIVKVDLTTGNPVSFMSDQAEFGAMDSVDIVPTTNTQPANSQCGSTNGLCSHYCFATPNGKRCDCPDGLYLDQTTRTACTTAPPTCPMQIPNGQLSPGCSGLVGASCDYSCNGTKFVKNPLVPRLTCTPSYFWNHPTDSLCIERVCPTSMRNGQLVNCNARANEACQWTCKAPLVKKPNTEAVICFSNGKWSTELDDLCVNQTKCPAAIPNGILQGCSYEPDESCTVTCNPNYSTDVDNIYCLPNGVWNIKTETLCTMKTETKCPAAIPNGILQGCSYEPDESCTVTCNPNYSTDVDNIYCLPNGVWNIKTETLCTMKTETKCPAAIANGILQGCSYEPDESCTVTCNPNYSTDVDNIYCLPNGVWNIKTETLCTMKTETKCPAAIPNGILQGCSYEPGKSCTVTCNPNYSTDVDNIHCLPDGVWNIKIETLCTMKTEKKCKAVVPNGAFKDCTFEPQQSCKVTCNGGYSSSVDFVHCLPDAVWENELENICQLTKAVTPEKQTQSSDTAGLTAAVAVVVTLLIIIIILAVAFYFFRRRIFAADKQNVQGRYRASPNVYFNASDSRGAATSPPEGFSNPSLHAGNGEAMPNTNPLKMDQINLSEDTTKQNIQNEGHYDSIKDGRPAAGVGPHEAVNPLYTTLQPREEIPYQNAEDVPEKPGYHRFN